MKKITLLHALYFSLFIMSVHAFPHPAHRLEKNQNARRPYSTDSLKTFDLSPDDYETFSIALVQEISEMPLYFMSLPFWAKVRCIGATAVGALAGNLTGYALSTLLGEYNLKGARVLHPSDWGIFASIGTLVGFAAAGYYAHKTESASGIAQHLDQKLIALMLKNRKNDASDLITDLNKHFVLQKFPRIASFSAIEDTYKKLTYVTTLIDHLTKLNAKNQFELLRYKIEIVCKEAQNAMVLIKQDPRWLEECSAHAVTLAQQNMQAHQQGQLATAVINLAHNK